jgi:hypothetical protein
MRSGHWVDGWIPPSAEGGSRKELHMLITNSGFGDAQAPATEVADDALNGMRGLVNGVVLSALCWAGILVFALLLF